jgi:hypothetical protein
LCSMWSSLAEMPRNTVGPPCDSVVMAWSDLVSACVVANTCEQNHRL